MATEPRTVPVDNISRAEASAIVRAKLGFVVAPDRVLPAA
jgi:hypothetical protein